MADPALQRVVREAKLDQERQDRIRETAQATAMAMQQRPLVRIVELLGNPGVENLDRPNAEAEYAGGLTLLFRVPGAETAYRVHFDGTAIDALHELLHSPEPSEEAPAEPDAVAEPAA